MPARMNPFGRENEEKFGMAGGDVILGMLDMSWSLTYDVSEQTRGIVYKGTSHARGRSALRHDIVPLRFMTFMINAHFYITVISYHVLFAIGTSTVISSSVR